MTISNKYKLNMNMTLTRFMRLVSQNSRETVEKIHGLRLVNKIRVPVSVSNNKYIVLFSSSLTSFLFILQIL